MPHFLLHFRVYQYGSYYVLVCFICLLQMVPWFYEFVFIVLMVRCILCSWSVVYTLDDFLIVYVMPVSRTPAGMGRGRVCTERLVLPSNFFISVISIMCICVFICMYVCVQASHVYSIHFPSLLSSLHAPSLLPPHCQSPMVIIAFFVYATATCVYLYVCVCVCVCVSASLNCSILLLLYKAMFPKLCEVTLTLLVLTKIPTNPFYSLETRRLFVVNDVVLDLHLVIYLC